ncbi:MAG: hypothetical protein U9N36_03035 [Euryarchaeota archaeon]|nr:hypothetical protein [Euryarchaeota archaeon]
MLVNDIGSVPPIKKSQFMPVPSIIIGFEEGVGVDSPQARRVQQELIKTYGGKEVGRNTKLNCVLVEVDKGKKVQEFIREITATKGKGV